MSKQPVTNPSELNHAAPGTEDITARVDELCAQIDQAVEQVQSQLKADAALLAHADHTASDQSDADENHADQALSADSTLSTQVESMAADAAHASGLTADPDVQPLLDEAGDVVTNSDLEPEASVPPVDPDLQRLLDEAEALVSSSTEPQPFESAVTPPAISVTADAPSTSDASLPEKSDAGTVNSEFASETHDAELEALLGGAHALVAGQQAQAAAADAPQPASDVDPDLLAFLESAKQAVADQIQADEPLASQADSTQQSVEPAAASVAPKATQAELDRTKPDVKADAPPEPQTEATPGTSTQPEAKAATPVTPPAKESATESQTTQAPRPVIAPDARFDDSNTSAAIQAKAAESRPEPVAQPAQPAPAAETHPATPPQAPPQYVQMFAKLDRSARWTVGLLSLPLRSRPKMVRNTVGWLALNTMFWGACVWIWMIFIRQPALQKTVEQQQFDFESGEVPQLALNDQPSHGRGGADESKDKADEEGKAEAGEGKAKEGGAEKDGRKPAKIISPDRPHIISKPSKPADSKKPDTKSETKSTKKDPGNGKGGGGGGGH